MSRVDSALRCRRFVMENSALAALIHEGTARWSKDNGFYAVSTV